MVFLIDFGIVQKYRNPASHIHILMQENLSLIGTPAFASINSHHGLQLSHRDNIKSLTYTLIFLHRGSLPWLTQDGKSPLSSIVLGRKQKFLANHDTGAHNIPAILAAILQHACGLKFTQKPNYGHLHTILDDAAEAM